MANDIIGAPVSIVVDGITLEFCPLQDIELAALISFAQLTVECTDYDNEALHEYLQTIAGATRLFYISVQRSQPVSEVVAADFVNTEETASAIYEAWFKLNFIDPPYPPATDEGGERWSKEEVYIYLAQKYRWGSEIVSRLTPYQQYVYCMQRPRTVSGEVAPDVGTADGESEYHRIRAKFNKVDK